MKLQTDTTIERQERSDNGVKKIPRNWKERRHDTIMASQQDKPFIGWDGEGYTDPTGRHHYALFGNSLGQAIKGTDLGWKQCINLILDSPKEAYHVIFAGTYDIVMMFRDTPVIQELLRGQIVIYQGYRLLFRKSKYLQVSKLKTPGSTRILYDVWTFFRLSFVATCREYGVGDEKALAAVETMKAKRNEFTTITQEVADYMRSELDLLVRLCDDLRSRLALANIYPHQWHGPGAVASAVLKREQIGPRKGSYSDDFRKSAEAAYYGGRFEQFQRGSHIGTIYQYDIRSAYPAAMTHLPDLSQVRWTHYAEGDRKPHGHNPYALYRIRISRLHDDGIGRLPYRDRLGTIHYPEWADGWYWGIECEHIPTRHRIESWHPTGPGLAERPFMFVGEAYRQRAILKKAGQPQQLAIKLMLNSLYGKLAQSKGAIPQEDGTWRYPSFHEVVWAGWITAYTRRLIADAMHTVAPSNIIACETDSVFSLVPLPLDVGEGLGQWELTESDGIRYIQSGISLTLKDGLWSFKTRGFTVPKVARMVQVWEDFLASTSQQMKITQTRFGTDPRIRSQFGQWYTTERTLSLVGSPLEKRQHLDIACHPCRDGVSYMDALHSMHRAVLDRKPSTPYKFIWRLPVPAGFEQVLEIRDLLFVTEDDPVLSTEYTTN